MQNQNLAQLRTLQGMGAYKNIGKRKLFMKALGGAGAVGAMALGAGYLSRRAQKKEIRQLRKKINRKQTEKMIRRQRYNRQMIILSEKVNSLEDVLSDLSESLGSMLSDLDVWTQGHVNMLVT